ncbi:ETS domain-containing protein [Caenorhabditis elegans]|uniref:ETS domain-containing protein n=1 Tax=Caenorhabditis elegans TaxID=6239 RepID=O01521_CAEEL|nr:ETS domain-containing protein [Caenorhabditis elegans]CCD67754.2 ETS domain-containing protein [Caenorhabditis elegans]|eukprot:NP_504949.2 Uncharacterized protein CELE_F19F10.1 [Caenorhabditis elegans]
MSSKRSSPTGKLRLLSFLRDLLEDESNSDIIYWFDKSESVFKMSKPHKVAELWGAATGNPGMNYDKMSRGLRYFYTNNTLEKVPGKDARYRFIDSPRHSFLDFSMKTELETPVKRTPLFNISNLISDFEVSNNSLTSSPTSSASSVEPSSPTTTESSLDPSQFVQLTQNLVQFNTFMSQNPMFHTLPLPTQLQVFFNFKTIFPSLFPALV